MKWKEEEIEELFDLVKKNGKKWKRISKLIGSKTAAQCSKKFTSISVEWKQGKWKPDEDRILINWVKNHGPSKWSDCANLIEGRSGKQCRERWRNSLNPTIKQTPMDLLEQTRLFALMKLGELSWANLTVKITGRSENFIKNFVNYCVNNVRNSKLTGFFKEYLSRKENRNSQSN